MRAASERKKEQGPVAHTHTQDITRHRSRVKKQEVASNSACITHTHIPHSLRRLQRKTSSREWVSKSDRQARIRHQASRGSGIRLLLSSASLSLAPPSHLALSLSCSTPSLPPTTDTKVSGMPDENSATLMPGMRHCSLD